MKINKLLSCLLPLFLVRPAQGCLPAVEHAPLAADGTASPATPVEPTATRVITSLSTQRHPSPTQRRSRVTRRSLSGRRLRAAELPGM